MVCCSDRRRLAAGLSLLAMAWLVSQLRPAAAPAGEGCCFTDGAAACMQGRLEAAEAMVEGGTFVPETGRDHRNYPPDRMVDHLRMVLAIRFESLESRSFTADERLDVQALGPAVSVLTLDAVGLEISKVERDGRSTDWFHDGKKLSIQLDPPLSGRETSSLRIVYRCSDPPAGMIFWPGTEEVEGLLGAKSGGLAAQLHTQGQPEQNRHWFACHDFPNERLATELIVDVPAGVMASSNGRLVSHQEADGRAVWHWRQDRPHVNYLVSLVVGTFERVDLGTAGERSTPMTAWVPPGRAEDARQTFKNTGRMIECFERRFGLAYPWDRYDQIVARNFSAGGMENTSVTTLYSSAVFDDVALRDDDLDSLIAHELGHQWFGNLLTCRSWAHLWLNEGFATYSSALWFEERDGEDGYLDSIRGNFNVARRDRVENPIGMVSNDYATPGENFGRAANPYGKGSSILHMLRSMLGEEIFWRGVHDYTRRHQDSVVETDDFRHALEAVSGRDLEWFFTQWCERSGTPRLAVKVEYEAAAREAVVTVEQTQAIDARTPAFRFVLPILAVTETSTRMVAMEVAERRATLRIPLDGSPRRIEIDPRLHVLKIVEIEAPLALLLEQAERGSTIAARRAALEALETSDRPEVIAALARIAADGSRRSTERVQAIGLISAMASPEAEEAKRELVETMTGGAVASAAMADPKVRLAVIGMAAKLKRDVALGVLTEAAKSESSYRCREAALDGLATLKATEAIDAIVAATEVPSQHDQVRIAAIEALAELDDARGLQVAIKASQFGNFDRNRPRAIRAVRRLAHHDRAAAVAHLAALLDDPESRSARAAGDALATLKAREARPRIATMAESDRRGESMRNAAKEWLTRMDEEGASREESGESRDRSTSP